MKDETAKQEANGLSLSEQVDLYTEGTAALDTGHPIRPSLQPPGYNYKEAKMTDVYSPGTAAGYTYDSHSRFDFHGGRGSEDEEEHLFGCQCIKCKPWVCGTMLLLSAKEHVRGCKCGFCNLYQEREEGGYLRL